MLTIWTNYFHSALISISKDWSKFCHSLWLLVTSTSSFCRYVHLIFHFPLAVALPWFMIAILPVTLCFFLLGRFFRASSRQLKRIDGLSRSPLYANLGEVLSGLVTIHSFSMEAVFRSLLQRNSDCYHSTIFAFWSTTRWFSLRLDLTTSAIVGVATVVALSLRDQPAFAAIALTYSLRMSTILQWSVRQFIESESLITSVERILDFAENIPVENTNDHWPPPPEGWISRGTIEFDNVTVRYGQDAPPVLSGISFSVRAGERIGIVGRTGAGKTSLISAFFRLVELDAGSIVIDTVDVSRLRLHDLRSNLSIIPQDPVLFAGTLRHNLDPFAQYSGEELWGAVHRVNLELGLDDVISENGLNVSVGQRQLICIARALLKRAKILVLDEATANISTSEDIVLQRVLREDFRDATVLCIAHRLNSVIDCSRVLVLDKGRVVEYAAPAELVKREGSQFRSLVNDTGAASSRHLIQLAMQSRKNLDPHVPVPDEWAVIESDFGMFCVNLNGM
jgi:ATP-binding cassette subfamily C (CFTR/MRP) protein 1